MPISKIDDSLIFVYIVVGSVIQKDGKFLLVQEKKPEVRGLWNLPAGKAEKAYSLEENAIKEVKEETGYDAKIIGELTVIHNEGDKSVKHVYIAEITGGEIKVPEDEILDARWFDWADIETLNREGKLRDRWVYDSLSLVANINGD